MQVSADLLTQVFIPLYDHDRTLYHHHRTVMSGYMHRWRGRKRRPRATSMRSLMHDPLPCVSDAHKEYLRILIEHCGQPKLLEYLESRLAPERDLFGPVLANVDADLQI